MNTMAELVRLGDLGRYDFNPAIALAGLLTAFILGQFTAWIYIYTHQGLSYSRAFVQSIVILTLIVCFAMMVIGSNIVIAFGLIGALSVIRFRNILKDTRDTAFVFLALIIGMGCGTGNYQLAVLSAVAVCAVVVLLHWTGFGSRNTSDGFVRFEIDEAASDLLSVRGVLDRYCRSAQLMSQRLGGDGAGEVAYRLIMRDPGRGDEMVAQLRGLGVSNVHFVLHEEQAEV